VDASKKIFVVIEILVFDFELFICVLIQQMLHILDHSHVARLSHAKRTVCNYALNEYDGEEHLLESSRSSEIADLFI